MALALCLIVSCGASSPARPPEAGATTLTTQVESTTTTVAPAPTSTTSTTIAASPPETPTTTQVPHDHNPPTPTSDLDRAIAAGVPSAASAVVAFSGCWGRTNSTHWGYYNFAGIGTTVIEPDGAVVQPGEVCLNPSQPSPYSSLLHELGHKFFWESGLWDRIIAEYGSYQRGAECFGTIWGATVFGTGGCPVDQELQMRAEFGW